MPIDEGMRNRFQEELDAKGIDNYKAASTKARWPDGTRFGNTYIRDVLYKEKRGSFQGIELLCVALHLDWPYVKTGKRHQLVLLPPTGRNIKPPDFDMLSELISSALRIFGASPQDAETTAKRVVSTWKATQFHD